MVKLGEIEYLKNIGEEGRRHAAHKPFSDPSCGGYLAEMGAIMELLPPPPARILDVGCGTGWTSRLLARRGYEVTGQDIAPDMIDLAIRTQAEEGLVDARFVVGDYEEMPFDNEFDAALFFDSLHHAIDEKAAIAAVYRALKPGGIVITAEPGCGHADAEHSQRAVQSFRVTERDMPPSRVIAAGRAAGFSDSRVYPMMRSILPILLQKTEGWRDRLRHARALFFQSTHFVFRRGVPREPGGLTVLIK